MSLMSDQPMSPMEGDDDDYCVACRTFHNENLDCPSEALDAVYGD